MPIVYRGFPIVDGRPMADGGLSDGLPAEEAVRRGARRIVVIRSRPYKYRKKGGPQQAVLGWYLRRYPALRAAVARQAAVYNQALDFIRRPPPGVEILEVSPPENFRVSRFTRNLAALKTGYYQGLAVAGEVVSRWNRDQHPVYRGSLNPGTGGSWTCIEASDRDFCLESE